MANDIVLEAVKPQLMAAIPVTVPISEVGRAWQPALDHLLA